MKNHIISWCAVVIIFFSLSVSACSSIKIIPLHNENIDVEFKPDAQVHFYKPNLYFKEGSLVVSGYLKGTYSKSRLLGHIDIAFIDSEEKISSLQSVKLIRKLPKNRNYQYSYTVESPLSSFDESIKIHIAYHQPQSSESFGCGNNLALQDIKELGGQAGN